MSRFTFRSYCRDDYRACMALFDANCPAAFAPNERKDYVTFLNDDPAHYRVCVAADRVVAAFGVSAIGGDESRLNWILVDPSAQSTGLGSMIMERATSDARQTGAQTLNIAASQKSEHFFARFGATTIGRITDGWGKGMDRVDMILLLET